MGPQDLIILLLIAESCDLGLANEKAGYWGTIASVLTILVMGGIIERVPFIRKWLDGPTVVLCKDGQPDRKQMRKCLVDEDDLEKVAREYGMESYRDFNIIVLEGDGSLTGIVKPEFRRLQKQEAPGMVS
ncbi:MAG TPA: YetF domain-containing protein [Coleofasciculaceae cyanobacterium]